MSHRGMPVTRQIRETRRNLANERQAEYDKLSLKQKLDRLPPEPFAAKQRARLLALLNKPVKAPEAEAPIAQGPSAEEKAQAKKLRKAMANAAMNDSTVNDKKGSK